MLRQTNKEKCMTTTLVKLGRKFMVLTLVRKGILQNLSFTLILLTPTKDHGLVHTGFLPMFTTIASR